MTALVVGTNEKDLTRFATAVRQLAEGRSNAVGSFTCGANVTSTLVTAVNCATSSVVILTSTSSAAASEVKNGSIYVQVSDVKNGQFTVTHSNTTTANRTFYYVTLG